MSNRTDQVPHVPIMQELAPGRRPSAPRYPRRELLRTTRVSVIERDFGRFTIPAAPGTVYACAMRPQYQPGDKVQVKSAILSAALGIVAVAIVPLLWFALNVFLKLAFESHGFDTNFPSRFTLAAQFGNAAGSIVFAVLALRAVLRARGIEPLWGVFLPTYLLLLSGFLWMTALIAIHDGELESWLNVAGIAAGMVGTVALRPWQYD